MYCARSNIVLKKENIYRIVGQHIMQKPYLCN